MIRLPALAALLALALAAAPARAQDDDFKPSFDCAKAQTAAEKVICATPSLGALDGMMSRYYQALLARLEREQATAEIDRLRRDQAAWLQGRDGPCLAASRGGADVDALGTCLDRAYRTRLVGLAARNDAANTVKGKPAPVWSGEYRRVVRNQTDGGRLFLLHWPDGTYVAVIETVSGPTHHTCDVTMSRMRIEDGRLNWSTRNAGEICRVSIAVSGTTARVAAENCAYYCGVRGYFDGAYRRP
jgi:uncharacterized protein